MEDGLSRLVADVSSGPRLLRLKPAVRRYAWGGYDYIPGLLGEANEARAPHAELWIGAHPVAPALAQTPAGDVSLAALLERAAPSVLGPELAARFGQALPYLLKILDVRSMLSIQVHPDARQARDGFEREEGLGMARTASNRNYRDASHKPEASVAVTDFWMLFGFRPVADIAQMLSEVPELGDAFRAAGAGAPATTEGEGAREWLRSAYVALMRMPQEALDEVLEPLLERLDTGEALGSLDRRMPDFWALRAAREFRPPQGLVDRGLLSIYLLNLVHLKPGEGVFIPAGVLHAHLEGVAVEVMAASDNVLRGGLTPKHVDLDELLKVVRFACTSPQPLRALREGSGEQVYTTPAAEFRLGRLDLRRGERFVPGVVQGADALLVLEGQVRASAGGAAHDLSRGAAVLATCGLAYSLEARDRAVVIRASVPRSRP
jgi:mannose-6-phosphate isomerase